MPAVATTGIVSTPIKRTYQGGVAAIGRGLALVQGANDSQLVPATAANVAVVGVSEEPTLAVGDPLSAILLGDATAIAGAAIAAGQYVVATATGQFIPSAAAGDNIAGRAISSAALQGDEFILLVLPSIR